jgi:lipopolysaccharide/colanic/teichoic acid biosynthesis glycosyltransferase
VLDIFVALAGLVVLAPLFLAVALLVRLKLGSPVLFAQPRPGLRGRIFTMWKFRTMLNLAEGGGAPLSDAERLTPFGRALRSSSLDELPELWNVLRGEMSIVGPRPLLVDYLPRYSVEEARRHEVRPGITGWAQVNGRNAITWEEKFRLDVWYVDNRSILLDLKIVGLTFLRVLGRDSISAAGDATMPEFKGRSRTDELK